MDNKLKICFSKDVKHKLSQLDLEPIEINSNIDKICYDENKLLSKLKNLKPEVHQKEIINYLNYNSDINKMDDVDKIMKKHPSLAILTLLIIASIPYLIAMIIGRVYFDDIYPTTPIASYYTFILYNYIISIGLLCLSAWQNKYDFGDKINYDNLNYKLEKNYVYIPSIVYIIFVILYFVFKTYIIESLLLQSNIPAGSWIIEMIYWISIAVPLLNTIIICFKIQFFAYLHISS